LQGKKKTSLSLNSYDIKRLEKIVKSRTLPTAQVQRAQILLFYNSGQNKKAIARKLNISRPTVYLCIAKALKGGVELALTEMQRSGRPAKITHEDKLWVAHIACSKPKDFGYAQELWTYNLLSKHIRTHAPKAKHSSLAKATKSMVHSILNELEVRPHKTRYYLEQRDPDFEEKMAQVLCVYKEVQLMNEGDKELPSDRKWVALSYDEKPGIQAIENTAPDLPPRIGQYPTYGRDHEYKRHGTLSLLAGIDLHTGQVLAIIRDTHRSVEFIEFLEKAHNEYPPDWRIRLILDNHSAHISKQTMKWLENYPNRFEFIFTPKHGSWLNLIESFFSKMARTFLRSIRVKSKGELKKRLQKYLDEVNKEPVVFRWKYKMDELF
jgi:transposase